MKSNGSYGDLANNLHRLQSSLFDLQTSGLGLHKSVSKYLPSAASTAVAAQWK